LHFCCSQKCKPPGLRPPPYFFFEKTGGQEPPCCECNRGVAVKPGGLKFFCKKKFQRFVQEPKHKQNLTQHSLYRNHTQNTFIATSSLHKPKQQKPQPAHYANQAQRIITSFPVAFLLFAKMQTPRPSATPLFFLRKNRGAGTPPVLSSIKPPPYLHSQTGGSRGVSIKKTTQVLQ
jgi:hypothetical protein